jgi:hypothetical protein
MALTYRQFNFINWLSNLLGWGFCPSLNIKIV